MEKTFCRCYGDLLVNLYHSLLLFTYTARNELLMYSEMFAEVGDIIATGGKRRG